MQSIHMQEMGCKSLSARGMQMDRRVSGAYSISFFWSRLLQTYQQDASGRSRWRWQHTSAAFGAALSRTSESPETCLEVIVLPNRLIAKLQKPVADRSACQLYYCASASSVPAD